MGRLGIGHYAGRHATQFLAGGPTVQRLTPGDGWDGTASSGFAVMPQDPLRVTAKPGLRLIVPPNQHYTASLPVGVLAFANDGGTLVGGIDRVRFHYEGEVVDVVEPVYYPVKTAKGGRTAYFGYWVELRKPVATTGEAHLYIEAIPADATMQSRVIGPYSFSPSHRLHDHELLVAPSQSEVAGLSYKTLMGAIQYCKTVAAQNPRITITEGGLYGMPAQAPVYAGGTGRLLIEATTPVTLGYASYTGDISNFMRPRYDGIHFRGPNITFDMRFVTSISHEGAGQPYWFDGVNVEISGTTEDTHWRSGPRPSAFVADGNPCWTECDLRDANDILIGATLARGNFVTGGYRDVATRALCLVDNTVADWDSAKIWARDVAAMTVSGPPGATLSISGANDANSRTLTAREGGISISTFKIGKTEAHYLGTTGDGYYVQDVVDWLDALPGWNASVLDNSRRASALSLAGTKGIAFTDVDVSVEVTLTTYFDQHGDFYQHPVGGPGENVIVTGTKLTTGQMQNIFLTRDNPRDFFFIDNAFANVETANKSQLGTSHSNVVIAHNTLANQDMTINPDYAADGYCLIANNSLKALSNVSQTPPAIVNNVLDAGGTAPASSVGTVLAGTASSKFVDAAAGDFTPAGELLTNLKVPIVAFGAKAALALAPSPVGKMTKGG